MKYVVTDGSAELRPLCEPFEAYNDEEARRSWPLDARSPGAILRRDGSALGDWVAMIGYPVNLKTLQSRASARRRARRLVRDC